ncbi:MAG: hypothetical protein NC390_07095 [Fusobacterium sp.]|nr:hypothetical protein [Fusobacterium sp.]
MSGLNIQKTEIITDKKLTLSSTGSANSDINITLNKNREIPKPDKATENKIKTMVAILYPSVEWNSLSDVEKQTYIVQYHDGTLEKKCKELQPKIEAFKESLKQMTPEEAERAIVTTTMARKDPNFKNYSKKEQDTRIKVESLQLLKKFNPELDLENMSEEEKNIQLNIYKFKLQTACYAYQTGKIDKLEDFKNFTPTQIQDLEYEFAKTTTEANEELATDTMKFVLDMGNLDRAIAEKNGMQLEEFRNSEDKYNIMLKYLEEKPEGELNEFERRQLRTLKKLSNIYESDLKGMNLTKEGSVTDSYLHQISGGKQKNWQDPAQFKILRDKIQADLEDCKTQEEKQAKIAEILGSCRGDIESAMIISNALAELEKKEVVSAPMLFKAAQIAKVTSHAIVACSAQLSEAGQRQTADYIAANCTGEHPEFTAKQAAGYTVNVTHEYQKDSQIYTVNKMTDTGIKEVHDVLPETYAKLDSEAAQQTFEYAMNSSAVSDEQKAIIARDTIDTTQNDDLKKFYQDLADKYKIDYNSVPPKSERVPANKETSTETDNQKVENTNYSKKEIAEILDQPQNNNFLAVVGNGIKETVDIILGKTPDNNIQSSIASITSLNSAITQLKSGTKLSDVFRQSNTETKKELVAVICTYGKTAIAQLIDAFGGQTIYKLAKTDAAKALIKKELERIALSDSTQRVELAEIKKAEEKDSLKAKA